MKNMVNLEKSTGWERSLIDAITDPKELLTLLDLDLSLLDAAKSAATLFPLKVPRGFVSRMEKGNINDPLLLQVLPIGAEHADFADYTKDPLGEAAVNPLPGLLHKYKGRVLLTFVSTCGINCRYCFRRHFPYADNNPGSIGWDKALEYIASDNSISEVILSGGDPLIANEKVLFAFSQKLNQIPHIKRLRIHSRVPIVMPERITPEFIQWISQIKQKPVLITHCNHPQEINQAVRDAMTALQRIGVVIMNQAVLLKGVNDNADTLVALSESLFEAGIQPYYLHMLDKVQGAAHFDTELEKAKSIHWDVSQRLSGYLVPKLVFEQAGAPAKLALGGWDFCTD